MVQFSETEGMKKTTDPYLEQFEQFENQHAARKPSWLFPIRKAGLARFAELGFPTLKDEDWRFTNVQPLAKLPFHPLFQPGEIQPLPETLENCLFADVDSSRLVFVNGHFSPDLSSLPHQGAGIQIMSLAEALETRRELVQEHLTRYSREGGNAFSALNEAFFQDGAFIHVERGVTVQRPVQLLYLSTAPGDGATTHPRNLIQAGAHSQLTILESYLSLSDAAAFTNAVTEFVVGQAATLEHCKFQDESPAGYHLAYLHAHIERDARFTSHSIASGARLSRNTIRTTLDGEGIECVLNGLYLTGRDQLADHYMVVDHAKPNCASHEYFNGILEDQSKGVFHGRILVRPDAQKTDAKQTNKNLLLSDQATIDTKPQLEIYADDVKCTHGATIGQLDPDSIFYLRTRGIDEQKARRMLVHAFAGEIIDRIQCAPAREDLDRWVHDRLEHKHSTRLHTSNV